MFSSPIGRGKGTVASKDKGPQLPAGIPVAPGQRLVGISIGHLLSIGLFTLVQNPIMSGKSPNPMIEAQHNAITIPLIGEMESLTVVEEGVKASLITII